MAENMREGASETRSLGEPEVVAHGTDLQKNYRGKKKVFPRSLLAYPSLWYKLN